MAEYHLTTAPPSLNNAFATVGKRRIKTADYKAWIEAAGWELKVQGITPVGSPYGISIEIGRKTSKSDIDNLIKPISDLLVKMGATPDDRKMDEVTIRRADREDVLVCVYGLSRPNPD